MSPLPSDPSLAAATLARVADELTALRASIDGLATRMLAESRREIRSLQGRNGTTPSA